MVETLMPVITRSNKIGVSGAFAW